MKYHVEFDINLKHNSYKGRYIALEGIDGSGKTTQVKELAKYFKDKGKKVLIVREPRKKGVIGNIVRKVLTGEAKMPSVALQYLFSTDRVINHEEVVIPALKTGTIVISDRCFWSAIVYGILDRMKKKYNFKDADALLMSQSILSMYNQFIVPDFTFYLKISLETSLSRISKKIERIEIYENKEKLKKLVQGYDWLAKRFEKEITIIDGEGTIGEVTREIASRLSS